MNAKEITEYEKYELVDINEKLEPKSIIENIKIILKREKEWEKGYFIILPPSGYSEVRRPNEEDGSGFYQYNFIVFKNPNTIAYSGITYGTLCEDKKKNLWIMEMHLEKVET